MRYQLQSKEANFIFFWIPKSDQIIVHSPSLYITACMAVISIACEKIGGANESEWDPLLSSSPESLVYEALENRSRKNLFQFSSVPWPIGSSGGLEGQSSRDPLPVFSAGSPCEQFWHRQIRPLFDGVYPAFHLPTTASPTLQDALKDSFGQAVVACDTPEPCKFPSLDSC